MPIDILYPIYYNIITVKGMVPKTTRQLAILHLTGVRRGSQASQPSGKAKTAPEPTGNARRDAVPAKQRERGRDKAAGESQRYRAEENERVR